MVRPDLWQAFIGSVNVGHLPAFPEWTPDDARQNPLLTMATTFATSVAVRWLYRLRQLDWSPPLGFDRASRY